MKLKLLMNITLLCLAATLQSQIIYVRPNATGDGSTWEKARGDLRQALNSANFGMEIWVAKGTYFTTKCTNCSSNDRKLTFEPQDGVAVYGGFNGTETQRTQRNWDINKTVLSGDIDGDGSLSNNTFNLMYVQNVGWQTVIDGFTFVGGNANDTISISERYTSGGAIYLDGRAGAHANPTVAHCIFKDNFANGFGGAVFNHAGYNGYCTSSFKNCQFLNNTSHNGGGAVCNWGVYGGSCNPSFEFCRFIGNSTNNSGGAVLSDAQQGKCEAIFINCQFIKNQTDLYGGGIYNLGKGGNCTPTVTGCLFWANKAASAAGIYCLGSENGNSNPRITNCIFTKNQAMTCGSVYANAGEDPITGKSTGTAKPVITNSIIWGNIAPLAPVLRDINGTPTISYSIVDAPNCSAIHSGVGAGVTCLEGMIYNQNPLFMDADNGDFRLLPGSPAINAGSNIVVTTQDIHFDVDSLPRIVANTVDIGAWEYNPSVQFPPKFLVSPVSRIVCAAEKIVLKTYATGSQPLYYQWFKNGVAIPNATLDSFKLSSVTLSDSGVYKCIVKNDINLTATSEEALLKVNPTTPLSISIVAEHQPQCEGDLTTLKATYQNGGAAVKLEWQLNGTTVATGDTYAFPIVSPFHKFTNKITSSEQCVSPKSLISNELNFAVETVETPEISLTALSKNICSGEKATFTTTIKNGGDTPQYQWLLNDISFSNNGNSFETTALNSGDKVQAVLKSSKKCLTKNNVSSNAETVFVKSRTLVALTMAADKSEICTGDSIIFTATGTGGGDTPQYMWLLNNTILPTKSPVLKLNALKNKDRVKAVLTSSENCTVKNPVESHVLTIIVNEPAMPSVDLAISKIMVCKGERIVFETTGQHLGVTPQYQWLRNGKSLNWESNSYATDSLRIDDAISVVVKSSNTCTLDRIATSKIVIPFVHICLFGKEYSDQQVLVYPNPSTQPQITVGLVNLKGTVQIDILTQRGQVIFTKIVQNVERDKEVHVEFSDMPDGLYIVRVRNGDFTTYKKWLIAK